MITTTRLGHTTIEEFERLIDSGVFARSRQRVDLLYGEIRFMSPAGPNHEDIVTYLMEWSVKWAEMHGYATRVEKSLRLELAGSVPEPDLAWVKRRRYRRGRPTAGDVGLVIEVAESSLRDDRSEMAAIYAEAGIQECWIANCIDNLIEVYRQPLNGIYKQQFVVAQGGRVSPLVAPAAELDVSALFAEE